MAMTDTETDRARQADRRARLWFRLIALGLFALLVIIAVAVQDRWIRPYGGDIGVIVMLHAALRGTLMRSSMRAVAAVLGLALVIEGGQALGWAAWPIFADNPMAQVVLGTTADLKDVAAYIVGGVVALVLDAAVQNRSLRGIPDRHPIS